MNRTKAPDCGPDLPPNVCPLGITERENQLNDIYKGHLRVSQGGLSHRDSQVCPENRNKHPVQLMSPASHPRFMKQLLEASEPLFILKIHFFTPKIRSYFNLASLTSWLNPVTIFAGATSRVTPIILTMDPTSPFCPMTPFSPYSWKMTHFL